MTEWKEYKLGEIATFGNGKVRPQKQGDIPIYGGNGILGYCDEYNYCGETVIVGRVGAYCGSVYYENRPIWVSDNALALKPKNNYNTKFIYYLLKKYNLNEYAEGSSHPLVTQTLLNAIEIIFTDDIEEQIRIASILSSLDDKIDLLHRENKTLEAMAETLFKELVVNENNDGTLDNIISIQNGYAFKSKDFKETGEHQIIKIKNISSGIIDIDSTDCVDSDVLVDVSTKFKVNSGDVLIAMTGAEIGKLGVIPKNDKSLWLNQRVGLLVEKYKGAKYLAYLQLKSEYGQDYIENTATGSAQPNISGTGIEQCGFPILDEEIIIQISKQIGEFYDKIILNLGQINVLKNTLNSMQFQLFNR